MTVSATEFLRRFFFHVLPRNFGRTRTLAPTINTELVRVYILAGENEKVRDRRGAKIVQVAFLRPRILLLTY
jgi:hypothetical protein